MRLILEVKLREDNLHLVAIVVVATALSPKDCEKATHSYFPVNLLSSDAIYNVSLVRITNASFFGLFFDQDSIITLSFFQVILVPVVFGSTLHVTCTSLFGTCSTVVGLVVTFSCPYTKIDGNHKAGYEQTQPAVQS